MRRALIPVLVIGLVHCASPGAAGPRGDVAPQVVPEGDPAAKEADIRRLLELTGAGALGIQVMDEMLSQLRQILPDVPERFWNEFRSEIAPSELVDLVVPLYARHFTHHEIRQIIAFYETPAGRSFVEKLPVLTAESQAAGEVWGRKVGERVAARLQAEGYLVP